MTNKSRFRVCRGCLVSSNVTNLINIFEETGENLRKFQEISRIDISKDENKFYAMICQKCLLKVETSFEIAENIRNIEKFFISKIRAKNEEQNCWTQSVQRETQIGIHKQIESEMVSDDPEEIMQESSDEEIEKEQEIQNFDVLKMEADKDVLAPMALFTEFTIEEFNELNLKVPEVNVEKMKMSEVTEKFKERGQSLSRAKSGVNEKILNVKTVNGSNRKNDSRPEKSRKCSVCSKEFRLNCYLKRHMLVHKFSNDNTANSNRPFKCSFEGCGKFFKSKKNLNQHKQNHKCDKVKCSICSKHFANKDSLRIHINHIHLKRNTFKCRRCSKTFNFKQNFLDHVFRIHIGKKKSSKSLSKSAVMTPNHCKICFKLYSKRSSLKVHIESVHEKKRKFTCDLCLKTFYYKCDLIRHIATHIFVNDNTSNARRPHRCDFNGCGKYFKTKKEVKHHKKQVHG